MEISDPNLSTLSRAGKEKKVATKVWFLKPDACINNITLNKKSVKVNIRRWWYPQVCGFIYGPFGLYSFIHTEAVNTAGRRLVNHVLIIEVCLTRKTHLRCLIKWRRDCTRYDCSTSPDYYSGNHGRNTTVADLVQGTKSTAPLGHPSPFGTALDPPPYTTHFKALLTQ